MSSMNSVGVRGTSELCRQQLRNNLPKIMRFGGPEAEYARETRTVSEVIEADRAGETPALSKQERWQYEVNKHAILREK